MLYRSTKYRHRSPATILICRSGPDDWTGVANEPFREVCSEISLMRWFVKRMEVGVAG